MILYALSDNKLKNETWRILDVDGKDILAKSNLDKHSSGFFMYSFNGYKWAYKSDENMKDTKT